MPLLISQRDLRGVAILDLDGSLILGEEAAFFRETFATLLGPSPVNVLLNLQKVKRIDSSGLGNLVSVQSEVAKAGGALKLLHSSQRHIDLLILTKLTTLFPNFDDEKAAVDSFGLEEQRGPKQFDILEFVQSQEGEEQQHLGGGDGAKQEKAGE